MASYIPLSSTEGFRLPSATRLGHVHLTVARLDHQIAFYTRVLGMTLHWRAGAEAALGTESAVLLRLTEVPFARRVQHTTGMYHFAILYPSRRELARAVARLFALRYPNAPTDHGVSKTTYLDDPEGNTIELYVRSLDDAVFDFVDGRPIVRYADGRIGDGRDPLDLEALFNELDPDAPLDAPLPQGAQIGHMHLDGSSLEASMDFYAGVLGFEPGPMVAAFRMGEVGLDAQQPHVIAFNTWKGTGIPPSPENALGMRYFTVILPDAAELERVVERVRAAGIPTEETPGGLALRDPSLIALILTSRTLPISAPG
jgi:catechol 2,3-dioxygenase